MTTSVFIRNDGPGKVKLSQVMANTDDDGIVYRYETSVVLPAGTAVTRSVWKNSAPFHISEVDNDGA